MELSIDKSAPVLVTGATGYVAGWVIKRLLEEGLDVRGTVRDPNNKEKLKYLLQLEEELPGSLSFFKANLNDAASFAEGMEGCSTIFHIASPFVTEVKDPQKDLVDPRGQRHTRRPGGGQASRERRAHRAHKQLRGHLRRRG